MRSVLFPIGALMVEIGAQEIVDALPAMPHLRVRRPGRIVPLVMLARPRQRRERLMDRRADGTSRRVAVGTKGQIRRSGERRAHQRERAEHIGPDQRAPRRDRGAEIVSYDRRGIAVAEAATSPNISRTAFSSRNGRRSSS